MCVCKTISTIKTSYINEKEKYYDILNLEDNNIGYIINYTFNQMKQIHIYGLMIIKSFEEIQNKKENLNIKLFGDKKNKNFPTKSSIFNLKKLFGGYSENIWT